MINSNYSPFDQNYQQLVERERIIDSHRKEWRDSASAYFDTIQSILVSTSTKKPPNHFLEEN